MEDDFSCVQSGTMLAKRPEKRGKDKVFNSYTAKSYFSAELEII